VEEVFLMVVVEEEVEVPAIKALNVRCTRGFDNKVTRDSP